MVSLGLINNWFIVNKLTLNLDKSMFITFGIYKNSIPDENFSIKISDHNLTRVSSCKYLGIYFDQHMRWDTHVNFLIKRVRYLLFIFYKLRHINKHLLKIMYYSLFLGVVSYAISVWGCAYDNTLKILQTFQNKILKIIKIGNLQFLNIKQLYLLNSVTYYYNDLSFLYNNSIYSARKGYLKLPLIKKSIFKKSPYIVSLRLFNSLPIGSKSIEAINSKVLKKKLLDLLRNNGNFLT